MRYFIEIKTENGQYSGSIHQGNPAFGRPLPALDLSPAAEVEIKGQPYPLGKLVEALVAYKKADLELAFDERGQLEIGHYLYRQLFGGIAPHQLRANSDPLDVRLVTNDEHIARLPWVLLAHGGIFLSAAGWGVSLARSSRTVDCALPPAPKLLIAAPEPAGVQKTGSQKHLDALEYRLSTHDPRLNLDHHLKLVTTWEEFTTQLARFEPDMIYYYGHGRGDLNSSRLLFEDANSRPVEVPIADMAQLLRSRPDPPRLVYLNCCQGDAGGFLGAGVQLSEIVPAVITNRTIAYVDAAQAQAIALWRSILLDAQPPHLAMAQMLGKLSDLRLSFSDARWMTPVIHCQYDNWQATPPPRVDPLEHDPYWRLKLDRKKQFGEVAYQTRLMLRERRPRSLAYIWYGLEGQGVEIFHERLQIELRQDLDAQAHFMEVRPDWPLEYSDPGRSFSEMMCEAFGVDALDDIRREIRSVSRGAAGRHTLVYIRHQPVRDKRVMNPGLLKSYLEWWNRDFVPRLAARQYALLTVSFEVSNPAKFQHAVLDKERLYDLNLSDTTVSLLDELERIGKKDLYDFLQTHNIRLPRSRREQILQEILERTQGHYERTIGELKEWVNLALDEIDLAATEPDNDEDEYDY